MYLLGSECMLQVFGTFTRLSFISRVRWCNARPVSFAVQVHWSCHIRPNQPSRFIFYFHIHHFQPAIYKMASRDLFISGKSLLLSCCSSLSATSPCLTFPSRTKLFAFSFSHHHQWFVAEFTLQKPRSPSNKNTFTFSHHQHSLAEFPSRNLLP